MSNFIDNNSSGPLGGKAPERPTLVYDDQCPFCCRWIDRWRRLTGERIDFLPFDQAIAMYPNMPTLALRESVWLIAPDGRINEGAAAVFRALALAGAKRHWWWFYKKIGLFRRLSEDIYSWIADRRERADRLDRWLLPDSSNLKRSYLTMRSLFLRGLGLIYLIAFLSLFVQIDGLVGKEGILPVELALNAYKAGHPELSAIGRFLHLPTMCWINSSDSFLHFLCLGGAGLSLLLIFGLLPMPVLVLLWIFYLSLIHAGQNFLGFQWDSLLVETGLLAIFFAPLQLRLRPSFLLGRKKNIPVGRPSRIVLFLLRWLLFRVMFLSGYVKWVAANGAWRELTAMRYHYETQPLPSWTSWYAHQLPNWSQSLSVCGVFFIEGLVPFLFFGPRIVRLFAFNMTVLLQLLIMATGNFGFFNLLALLLCLTLLDDACFARLRIRRPNFPFSGLRRWPGWIVWPIASSIVLLSLVPSLDRMHQSNTIPTFLRDAYARTAPYCVVNPYGLFEEMTMHRPELIVQGSDDGEHWIDYQFKWKPGDVNRAPQFCTPHMPRVDWQMWFAALYMDEGAIDLWTENFLYRLEQNSPAVVGLLESNPFPHHPPRYVRMQLYDYRFTSWQEGWRTGKWWDRTLLMPDLRLVKPIR